MLEVWAEYRKNLKVMDADESLVQSYRSGVDPDDAVFLALAEAVQAVGVISKDRHIAMMGGQTISVDFVLSLRDYSRAAAIELNIRCMGISLTLMGVATIRGIFEGITNGVLAISKAPDWMKLTLLFGVAFCVLHPGARQRIGSGLAVALEGVREVTPSIVSSLAQAAAHANQHGDIARKHLQRALQELQ
jgi:hypothetical protein